MLTDLVCLIEGKPSVSDGVMERLNCCNLVWVSLINGMEWWNSQIVKLHLMGHLFVTLRELVS